MRRSSVAPTGRAETRPVDFIDSAELDNDPGSPPSAPRAGEHAAARDPASSCPTHNPSYTPGPDHLADSVPRGAKCPASGADVANGAGHRRATAPTCSGCSRATPGPRPDSKARAASADQHGVGGATGLRWQTAMVVVDLSGPWLSFAVGESGSAPGQIPIGDLRDRLRHHPAARGGEMF